MAGVARFELANVGIKVRCLNQLGDTPIELAEGGGFEPPGASLHLLISSQVQSASLTTFLNLVTTLGFEPKTPCSQSKCSTRLSYAV